RRGCWAWGTSSARSPRATRPTSCCSTSTTSISCRSTTPPTRSCSPRAAAPSDKVLIGGKLVVTGGRAIGIDRAALAAQAQAAVECLAALNADARRFAERIEPIVSNFCRGLADDDMMHRLRRDLGRPDARCVY